MESLIIRIMLQGHRTQFICLSATISNPELLVNWLNSISERCLSSKFILIKSNVRPVELNYRIEIARNKDSHIRQSIKKCLNEGGQVLIFTNTRKSSKNNAKKFKTTTKRYLSEQSKNYIEKEISYVKKKDGKSRDLHNLLRDGIAYHNAGLISSERTLIEKLFAKKHIKVICCTTTLAAGINTPARLVILRDFKKKILFSYKNSFEVKNGALADKYKELPGVNSGYFIPFSNNQVFQLLGRAGRPGLDITGTGVILVKDQAEYEWVENNYYKYNQENNKYEPKYNPVISTLNKIGALREQVLLLIHQLEGASIDQLVNFFKLTYFNYNFKSKIGIENYLYIKPLDTKSILALHSNKSPVEKYVNSIRDIFIQKLSKDIVDFYVNFHEQLLIRFDINEGIVCSCGQIIKPEKLKEYHFVRNDYQFCPHIIAVLQYLVQNKDRQIEISSKNSKKCKEIILYLDDIIPQALRTERIIDFLLRTGFIIEEERNSGISIFECTDFGKLTVRLYLKPISMLYLRDIILDNSLSNFNEIIDAAWVFLKNEGRYRSELYTHAMEMWINEEKVDSILTKYNNISGGDFYNFQRDLVRVMGHFESVAQFYDKSELSDNARTLAKRIEHGIKEELFDLVIRIKEVGRIRGRILYNAGFEKVGDIYNSNPVEIKNKTRLSPKICKIIYDNSIQIKHEIFSD
ncbi:MAG: hypothetical protein GF364_14405 [Candidatus Lokiarchaeota archaeon]|nr:hypothetical protein [Candidatus Lokiarchaeota archaeon]